jgi:acetoin utilization deacetylase AcuC-like enzyme
VHVLKTVGWLDSPAFDRHQNGISHPECPQRLEAIRLGMADRGLDTRLVRSEAEPVARDLLDRVHDPEYVATVEAFCRSGGGRLDPDTSVIPESWDAALKAAGAVAKAVEHVASGAWHRALCTVRPPGHHAPRSRAMGFCLFGNAGVGAQAALDAGYKRVAIVDWDIHHGNGTQALFYDRNDVFYASWHQFPFYPGTGRSDETGVGAGAGFTLNCPLPAGAGNQAYLAAWDGSIRPALDEYGPEFLIISAGFDADARDPLGGHMVTASGFEQLSSAVVEWADQNCEGRVVSVLEGGYSLAALAEDVPLHAETLLS